MNSTPPDSEQLLRDFSLVEAHVFLEVFERAAYGYPNQYPSFRELFAGLGPHTTTLSRIASLFEALLPISTPGVPTSPGDRLKMLFTEQPDGLRPTELAKIIGSRVSTLKRFVNDLSAELIRKTAGPEFRTCTVRLGAPPTLAMRLLCYAYSDPLAITKASGIANEVGPISLRLTTGDTWERLLPRLLLDQLDAVVGYGLPTSGRTKDRKYVVYRDPEVPTVNFRSLNQPLEMVLISHPEYPPAVFEGSKLPLPGKQIDPRTINLRQTPFVAVASWRQSEAVQELMDLSARAGRLQKVRTYDEALAVVRTGGGVAIVPEIFQHRRIIESRTLSKEYRRELGVYYRSTPVGGRDFPTGPNARDEPETRAADSTVSEEACMLLEFLAEYAKGYPAEPPPAYCLPGRSSADEGSAADNEYEKILAKFREHHGNWNKARWKKHAQKHFPCDDSVVSYSPSIHNTGN